MSKRAYIARYSFLLRKLEHQNYPDWPEIQYYMERELELLRLQDENISPSFSKRTFDRDKADLRDTFGIYIRHSPQQKGYYIEGDSFQNQRFRHMVATFDKFNALRLMRDASPYIHLEQRQPQGTEHLYNLLDASIKGLEIRFRHKKFWEEQATLRHVAPYGLKEFGNRWYLLARDYKDNLVKTFALDRLWELEITKRTIDENERVSVEDFFRHAFGVIVEKNSSPEEVVLSFTASEGCYVKSLPLHSSQEIIKSTSEEFRVKLTILVTYDFRMKLLSFGDQVKVLTPQSLKTEIREWHRKAYEAYDG